MTLAAMVHEKDSLPHSGDRPASIIAVEKSGIK